MRNNSYSYSMLSTFLRCPALYKMQYIDKIPLGEEPSLALDFGTALHAALNASLEGADGDAVFDAYWGTLFNKVYPKGRHSSDDLKDMGTLFLDRFNRLHKCNYKLLRAEDRFYVTTPRGIKLEGTMDALVEYKGKITLMDFKTSATRYAPDRTKNSMQLALYTYLAEKTLNIKIEQIGYTVFLKQKDPSIQVILMDLDRGWLDKMINNIEDICHDINTRETFPKNYNSYFDYGRQCPACIHLTTDSSTDKV